MKTGAHRRLREPFALVDGIAALHGPLAHVQQQSCSTLWQTNAIGIVPMWPRES